MPNHHYYSLGTLLYAKADPAAAAIARACRWLIGQRNDDGTWGRKGDLDQLICTVHAVMTLLAIGYAANSPVLKRALEFLRGIDKDHFVWFYWRSGAFLNIPGYEREVRADVRHLWTRREHIGAHPDYPLRFFLLKLLRFSTDRRRMTVTAEQVLPWILKEWRTNAGWYGRVSIISMGLGLVYDMRFRGRSIYVQRSVTMLKKRFKRLGAAKGRFDRNLIENCFVVFNLCERNALDHPSIRCLRPLVEKAVRYILDKVEEPAGVWNCTQPPFGGAVSESIYPTCIAVRALLSLRAKQDPAFLSEVASCMLNEPESRDRALHRPTDLQDSLADFERRYPSSGKRCFVMMRFTRTKLHKDILRAIKMTCERAGIRAIRADEKSVSEELLENIRAYMHGCDFGVAVFERIDTEEFNPNISLEVGYMMALGKPVCMLKDKNLRALQADLVGVLYRPFDTQAASKTIRVELDAWLRDKDFV